MSLCLSFMLLFYEPLNMFSSNIEDFWFDIYSFFPVVLAQTLIAFVILSLFFIVIKKLNKKLYSFLIVCFFIGLVCTYIQGNFLAGSLPAIDGNWVDFDLFKTEKMISIILWVVVSAVILFSVYKFKYVKVEKASFYLSLAIIAMLLTSMVPFLTKEGFFDSKKSLVTTIDGINDMSSDKNVIIFLLDATDSYRFNKEIEKLKKTKDIFRDFTYFPDTVGGYPFTQYSIPLIFSGEWYENKEAFPKYLTKAYDNSLVFKKLEDEGYTMSIYDSATFDSYTGNNYDRFTNIKPNLTFNYLGLFKQEAKLIMYKYLPYQLKWRAEIDTLDLGLARGLTSEIFKKNNVINYNRIRDEEFNIVDYKNFQFIHLEGAHNPQRYDINLNTVENGEYEGNLDACITILETYLNKLRDNEVYDNSAIVVMADHGWSKGDRGRSNPILYFKGFNEHHSYEVSDKKVSYENLVDAFIQIIDGDSADKLFEGIDNSKRRYMFYDFGHEDKLKEHIQTGVAWDESTLKSTGKVYVRE